VKEAPNQSGPRNRPLPSLGANAPEILTDPKEHTAGDRSWTHRLVPASSVKPERVTWAWRDHIPIGMVSLLVGQGAKGKSTELCRLAAGWSRGTLPGDLYGLPVSVAIASAEDHRAAVIVPRLMAAGADLARVHFVEAITDGVVGDIEINGQVEELENTLSEAGIRVLLVDTVVSHVPQGHDSYKEQDVRAVLKPLARMAERCGMVVLGTMHLNRREARDVLTRISGSGAFGNLARSVLLFAEDPDDPDGPTRILAVGKSNVGARASALRLRIEGCLVPGDDGEEILTSRLVVVGDTNHTASDLLGAPADKEDRSAISDAVDFLRDLLGDGAVSAGRVRQEAKRADIAWATVRRAQKDRLRIVPRKQGMGGGWVWELPAEDAHAPREDAPAGTVSTFSADEHLRTISEADGSPDDRWLCSPRTTAANGNTGVDDKPPAAKGLPNGLKRGPVVQPALPMPFRPGDGAAGMRCPNGNKLETANQGG